MSTDIQADRAQAKKAAKTHNEMYLESSKCTRIENIQNTWYF